MVTPNASSKKKKEARRALCRAFDLNYLTPRTASNRLQQAMAARTATGCNAGVAHGLMNHAASRRMESPTAAIAIRTASATVKLLLNLEQMETLKPSRNVRGATAVITEEGKQGLLLEKLANNGRERIHISMTDIQESIQTLALTRTTAEILTMMKRSGATLPIPIHGGSTACPLYPDQALNALFSNIIVISLFFRF